jgi:hypothetical protein
MMYQLNSSRQYSQGPAALIEVSQMYGQTAGQLDEEGASQEVRDGGIRSDKCCHFLTVLNNILTVGELAGG